MTEYTYSVGKGTVHAYRDSADEARAAHTELGLNGRVGIYRWDIGPAPEGHQGRTISNPVRLPLRAPQI